MSHLLHLDSSIRGIDESRSRKLSARYARAWLAAHPDGQVTYRDLAADAIPHTDAVSFYANHLPPDALSPLQAAARALTDHLVEEVMAASTIVLGMGLYNFGVPTTVKAWYDRIVVPGRTLYEDGSGGALGGRQLVLTLAAGGGYAEGTPRHGWDHRLPWIRHAFQQIGLTDIVVISAELTLARESPALIPLDLGAAEDESYAAAEALIDAQFDPATVA